MPSPLTVWKAGEKVGRHAVVKQLVLLNAALYGGYLLSSGPVGLMYRKYFTIDADSSFLSAPLCHFGHTNPFTFLFTTGTLWTIGNSHLRAYGCNRFFKVLGLSAALATAAGLWDQRTN